MLELVNAAGEILGCGEAAPLPGMSRDTLDDADQQTALGKAQAALDGVYRLLQSAVPADGPPSVQAVLHALLGPLVDAAKRAQAALGGAR